MTLEFLEVMEDVKKTQEKEVQGASSPRSKLAKLTKDMEIEEPEMPDGWRS